MCNFVTFCRQTLVAVGFQRLRVSKKVVTLVTFFVTTDKERGKVKENPIRQSSRTYKPYNRNFVSRKAPGKVVGIIAVGNPDGFNTNVVHHTVSKYRKDLAIVQVQTIHQKIAILPEYERDLFDSCFKNWS